MIASKAENQDKIKKAFVNHENTDIQQFSIENLLSEEIEISPEWLRRFEVSTDNVNNSIYKLNEEVYKTVLMFKFQLIEQYLHLLKEEMHQDHSDKIIDQILAKYDLLIKRRAEIAKLMDMVVAK